MKPRTFVLVLSPLALCALPASQAVSGSSALPDPFFERHALPLPDVLFVDASATSGGDGSSWTSALDDLQDALFVARLGTQVWVAAGTYTPAPPDGPNAATFSVPSGVAVFGGFAGTEMLLGQRDPLAHVTILSGDLDGDDTYTPVFDVGFGDNAWHVVTMEGASPETRVDGFTILGGHSFGAAPGDANGGGVVVRNGAGTLANCEVAWSVANHGGAVFVSGADALLEDCRFHNNFATTAGFAGGAVANDSGSSVVVRDSTFTFNTADGVAGGVAGGALANATGATMTVERCSFSNNVARNRLPGQTALAYGGAIYNQQGTLTVSESTFTSNTSNSGGAIFGFSSASTTVRSSLFAGNFVTKYVLSGGIEGGGDGGTVVGGTGLVMTGCLVYGGTADNIGGVSAGAGLVSCCIFWNNQDDKGDIGISQVKADEVRYSCVQNMLVGEPGEDPPDPEKFPGSTAADPLFADLPGGDFRLSSESPLIDAGENSVWPLSVQVDLDGNPRFVDDPATPDTGVGPPPVVDMGPYELPVAALLAGTQVELHVTAGAEHAGRTYVLALTDGNGSVVLERIGVLGPDGDATERVSVSTRERRLLGSRDVGRLAGVFLPSGALRLLGDPLGSVSR